MISVCNPCESVVGSRKRFFKCVFQIERFNLWFLILSGENVITGAKRRGVKVSHENDRDVVGEMGQPLENQFGASGLDRDAKVQVCVDTNKPAAGIFEHADGALSRPEAFPKTARHRWC